MRFSNLLIVSGLVATVCAVPVQEPRWFWNHKASATSTAPTAPTASATASSTTAETRSATTAVEAVSSVRAKFALAGSTRTSTGFNAKIIANAYLKRAASATKKLGLADDLKINWGRSKYNGPELEAGSKLTITYVAPACGGTCTANIKVRSEEEATGTIFFEGQTKPAYSG